MDLSILWGSGEHLSPLQMGFRAFIAFFVALACIRLGGMRILGKKTAFDSIVAIMLGAILARGVVGASPFIATVTAAVVLVVIHRVLALLAMKHAWIGKIVKGEHMSLYRDGQMNERNMWKSAISKDDLHESVRLELNSESFEEVKEITIEKNGHVSVTKK
ncbi:DUF421 domain-containing protein [Flavihumibacter petaseus]|uniref:YetF C-terminal domain-containing protein n=1 Tax=Flavihumibacter petaseus NBRC 106054 TaxID=1220578 RepID=A0A0E9N2E9_9BACT|nr:YetF domain-containing protein [Flavihumibacter petaseus]GAO44014.1 hypothetical protein FPE01S_03_00530 [Flavihumibacter petaseus NBRC 106054]